MAVDRRRGRLVRAEACRALGKVGRPEDATILARVMTVDTLGDCRVAAIEGLGELKSHDQRIIAVPRRRDGARRPGHPRGLARTP